MINHLKLYSKDMQGKINFNYDITFDSRITFVVDESAKFKSTLRYVYEDVLGNPDHGKVEIASGGKLLFSDGGLNDPIMDLIINSVTSNDIIVLDEPAFMTIDTSEKFSEVLLSVASILVIGRDLKNIQCVSGSEFYIFEQQNGKTSLHKVVPLTLLSDKFFKPDIVITEGRFGDGELFKLYLNPTKIIQFSKTEDEFIEAFNKIDVKTERVLIKACSKSKIALCMREVAKRYPHSNVYIFMDYCSVGSDIRSIMDKIESYQDTKFTFMSIESFEQLVLDSTWLNRNAYAKFAGEYHRELLYENELERLLIDSPCKYKHGKSCMKMLNSCSNCSEECGYRYSGDKASAIVDPINRKIDFTNYFNTK